MSEPSERELSVFSAARRLAAQERAAYLDQSCAEDAALRQRVEQLLQAGEEAPGFLLEPAPGARRPFAPSIVPKLLQNTASPGEQAGDRIGHYKLLRQIGEGGCGVVYLAEQEEPVRRRVALKVIKLGMDTKSVIARFEAERQALALMEHPNIAKVLDAGATDTGRPYFVMELVEGLKITDYCDRSNLSTRERLNLFVEVCQAVQHAHQKGVIHRDLKPSNILVTPRDGPASAGCPKVIDFGIAKATTGQPLTDKTVFTAFEQFMGTPAYMSSEQAEMSELSIDTRTDIYSLGVLLYELLTGRTPFDAAELLQSGLEAMRRTIREKEPSRPSTRLSTLLEGELSTTAKRRQIEPLKLIHLVRGDLDWIVMKCLEKDRSHRYDTANALALDIERYLANEPVAARPPSRVYRLRKLIHRNKLAFAAASATTAALVLGLIASTYSLVRERAAHERAAAASRESRMTLAASYFSQAIQLISNHNHIDALAYLARSLSLNPTNNAASTRLITLLAYHSWMLPTLTLPHADEPLSAQFSPDGTRVVTASSDQIVRVWDARNGKLLLGSLRHLGAVHSAQFSSDGQRIVTASADQTAMVWDAQSGQPASPALRHDDAVFMARFSPDAERVVTASADGSLRIWNARTGRPLTEPLKHGGRVRTAEFDCTGELIVSASDDLTARVWDANTGECLVRSLKHGGWVSMARFSPDGRRIVTASFDHSARVWDTRTGQPVTPPLKHAHQVAWAEFSPDGKRVVTASLDNTARVWDAQTGEPVTRPLPHENHVGSAQFSSDGSRIVTASADGTARVWYVVTGQPACEALQHDGAVTAAQFSPDGKRVITAAADRGVSIWDRVGREALGLPFQHGLALRAEFSPDGHRLVTAANRGSARVWDARSGRPLAPPLPHDDQVLWAVFSPDGKRILTASLDGTARIWDAQTGQPLAKPLAHRSAVQWARFSPDGRQVITASSDSTARVWDAGSGEPLTPPLIHGGEVGGAEFSPDGKRVLTFSRDKSARVWDAQTGAPLTPPLRHKDQVRSAHFSPNGARVVTASWDHTARVWDAQSGQPVSKPLKHGGAVRSAQFSPDGKRIVTASDDGTARIWEAEAGQPVTKPLQHGAAVNIAEFSPDGRRIATATISAENTLLLWDADTGHVLGELVTAARAAGAVRFSQDGRRLVMGCAATSVWDLPPVTGACPRWLLSLAEGISGQTVDNRNLLEKIESNRMTIVNSVREQLQESAANDWVTWGRWFLAKPDTETISPHSSMTLAEYVENRIESGTTEAVEECERLPLLGPQLLHRIEQARAKLEQQQRLTASRDRFENSSRQGTNPRSAAPESTEAHSTGRQVIYDDTLQNDWENKSWAKVDFANTSSAFAGSNSISVLAGPRTALYLRHTGYGLTNFDQLSFWVNGGESAKELFLQATLKDFAQPGVPLTVPGGEWTQVIEPLSALGVEGQRTFDGFWLQENTGSAQKVFYVDQIELQQSTKITEANTPPRPSEPPRSRPDVPR